MPRISIPIVQGKAQNSTEIDWIDSLPINLLAVPLPVLDAIGYMRSWPSLVVDTSTYMEGNTPVSSTSLVHNGIFDTATNSTFRINGSTLQEYKFNDMGEPIIINHVENIEGIPNGSGYIPIDYSINTVAYVVGGSLCYLRDLELNDSRGNPLISTTKLKNWNAGDKALGRNNIYSLNFDQTRVIELSSPIQLSTFNSANEPVGYIIDFEIYIKDNSIESIPDTRRQYILGGVKQSNTGNPDDSKSGLILVGNRLFAELYSKINGMLQQTIEIATLEYEKINSIAFQTRYDGNENATGRRFYSPNWSDMTNFNVTFPFIPDIIYTSSYYVSFDLLINSLPSDRTIATPIWISGQATDRLNLTNVDVVAGSFGGMFVRDNKIFVTNDSLSSLLGTPSQNESEQVIKSVVVNTNLQRISFLFEGAVAFHRDRFGSGFQLGADIIIGGQNKTLTGLSSLNFNMRNFEIRNGSASGDIIVCYPIFLKPIGDDPPQTNKIPPAEKSSFKGVGVIQVGNADRPIGLDNWKLSQVTETDFDFDISFIGGRDNQFEKFTTKDNFFDGELRFMKFTRLDSGTTNPSYNLFQKIPFGNDVPTNLTLSNNSQTAMSTSSITGTVIEQYKPENMLHSSTWLRSPYGFSGGNQILFPAKLFPLDRVIDVVRNQARYIYLREGDRNFWITDIDDETRPDYYAASYDANSHYGYPIACEQWRNLVVIFSKHNTTFYNLTGSNGVPNSAKAKAPPIYEYHQSLTVACGALHKGAVCRYQDQFVVLGSPINEPISVYLIQAGNYTEIASRYIQQVLRELTLDEINEAYIEPFKFDHHDGFILHLPNQTFMYDKVSNEAENLEWKILSSSIDGSLPYRAKYHVFEENRLRWTAGDLLTPTNNILDFTKGTHRGEAVLYEITTPLIEIRNKSLLDFEIDNVTGLNNGIRTITLSATYDGQTFLKGEEIELADSTDTNRRILARNLGYSRNDIGFRLQWVSDLPSSISNFRIRVEG